MSSHETSNCFICNKVVTVYIDVLARKTEFNCDTCGQYCLSDCLKNESSRIRPIMFHCLLHNANKKRLFFVRDEPSDKGRYSSDAHFITKESLESMQPKNLNEKIDMIMLNLGKKIRFWGDGLSLEVSESAGEAIDHLIRNSLMLLCTNVAKDKNDFSNTKKEISGTLEIMEKLGYLERRDNSPEHTFTVNGWKHLGELQSELSQGFIAMSFSSEMNETRDTIKKVIVDCGYMPRIIDEKEHNNQIVPEIFYEIKRSKFLVADLTGHRNGVYYEAGYAQGLGKEVILTCHKDDFKHRHFDVAQIATIVWEDKDDLKKRLKKRIEATVEKRSKLDPHV